MQIDRDTVIAWTKEYKFIPDLNPDATNALGKSIPIALLEHIAQKAAEAEREACAQLCDEQPLLKWMGEMHCAFGAQTRQQCLHWPLRIKQRRNIKCST